MFVYLSVNVVLSLPVSATPVNFLVSVSSLAGIVWLAA